MKRTYIKAFNELKKLGVPVYERDDMDGRARTDFFTPAFTGTRPVTFIPSYGH